MLDASVRDRLLDLVARVGSDAIEVTDLRGRLVYVNPAFEELTGYTAAQAIGRTPAELLRSPNHDPLLFHEIWDRVAHRGESWTGEFESRRADGTSIYVLCVLQPVQVDGRTVAILAVKRPLVRFGDHDLPTPDTPVSTRLAISMLTASERRWRAMVTHAGDAMLVVDHDTALFVDANPAAERLTGYTVAQLRRRTGRMITAPEAGPEIDRLSSDLNTCGRAEHPRLPMIRVDGTRYHASLRIHRFDVDGRSLHLAVLRDVSQQVASEERLTEMNARLLETSARLLRSDRLAKLGQLSASIAHEINNPAQWVRTSLEVLAARVAGDGELSDLVSDALEGLGKIQAVTAPLLPFVRADDPPGPVEVVEVVRDALRLVGNDLRHRARVELDLHPAAPVLGHRGRLVQVVTNLLVNAVQALVPEDPGRRTIRVETRSDFDEAVIAIHDTGRGMPEEQLARVLEPFVTTRPGGTGLGLALCDEIVRQHHGRLVLTSEVGRGTCATVRFPVACAEHSHRRRTPTSAGAPDLHGLRVLVVDDDPLVLRAFARLLRPCEVITLASPRAALARLRDGERFDALICDLMLPEMSGPALYEALPPDVRSRVVFCSGGAFGTGIEEFLSRTSRPVLAKPVGRELLSSTLRSVVTSNEPQRPLAAPGRLDGTR